MTDQLITKIVKAGVDVGGKLRADKTNKEQNYDYLSADKILNVCGQALFDQGVSVLPGIVAQETSLYEYTDQYGKAKRRYDSRVQFEFLITDGTVNQQLGWFGMGSDYTVPDKALYKAITSGHKYFLMKLLCIGAGNEDGEHESEEETVKPKAVQAKPVAKSNGGQPADEAATQDESKKKLVYTSPVAKIFQHTYPSEWVKKLMANPQYRADQPHIDNLLQQFAFPQEMSADEVLAKVDEHIAQRPVRSV